MMAVGSGVKCSRAIFYSKLFSDELLTPGAFTPTTMAAASFVRTGKKVLVEFTARKIELMYP